jgi:FG-GAP-like repeat
MRVGCWHASTLIVAALAVTATAQDTKVTPIAWKKTVIDQTFRSEGVAIADVNKDGKMDILLGEAWFEAPSWKMHEIRKPPRDYGDGLKSYSESFACWTDDINKDGWPDLIVIRWPGAPCYWYENPQGKPGHWKEHEIWHSACNETPQYVDLLGTGKRVLVMGWQPPKQETQGQMAYFAPGKDPTKPWEMQPISEPSAPKKEVPGTRRFSHGLGVSDLNGDGRLDVICTGGWWEQPAKPDGKPWPFRAANLGDACADMFAHDVDGDGKLDVISTSAHKFGIWWHQQRASAAGSPAFIKQDFFTDLVSETHALHFVDINGDGLKDLVTGKRWWSHGRSEPGADMPPRLYWFEAKKSADGMTRFTPHMIDEGSGIGTQFVVTDFNGDKLLDIVVSSKKGTFLFEQVRK